METDVFHFPHLVKVALKIQVAGMISLLVEMGLYFKGLIGQPDRDGECHDDATSINGFCRYKSLEGGVCDEDDRDDCLDEENYCLDQICKTPGNVACQDNGSCGNDSLTCVNGSCTEKGGSCDEVEDCIGDQFCHLIGNDLTCTEPENLICDTDDTCHEEPYNICRPQGDQRLCTSIGLNYASLTDNDGNVESFCDQGTDCQSGICFRGVCRTPETLVCESSSECRDHDEATLFALMER